MNDDGDIIGENTYEIQPIEKSHREIVEDFVPKISKTSNEVVAPYRAKERTAQNELEGDKTLNKPLIKLDQEEVIDDNVDKISDWEISFEVREKAQLKGVVLQKEDIENRIASIKNKALNKLAEMNLYQYKGSVSKLVGITVDVKLPGLKVGDLCYITNYLGEKKPAEVVAFKGEAAQLQLLYDGEGIGHSVNTKKMRWLTFFTVAIHFLLTQSAQHSSYKK